MMIDTKPYQLQYTTYQRIFFRKVGRNIVQLFPFLLIWTLLFGWQTSRVIALYSLLLFILIGLLMLIWFSVKNLKPFFKPTRLQFNAEQFSISIDGEMMAWNFSKLRNVVAHDDYWLLYLTINTYVYVPKDIFYSEADFIKFKSLLRV